MKKILKITLVFLIILNLYSIIFSANAKSIWDRGNDFLDIGSIDDIIWDSNDEVKNQFKVIIDFLWGLGLLIIVISTIILGIKYMMVLPNEKSRLKQATTPYIIGVVVIFGAVTIWKFIIDVLEGSMLGG